MDPPPSPPPPPIANAHQDPPAAASNDAHIDVKLSNSAPAPPVETSPTRPRTPVQPHVEIPPPPPTPTYPQLSNNPPASPDSTKPFAAEDRDEESSVPKSFGRSSTNNKPSLHQSFPEEGTPASAFRRMHKFSLYETAHRYYIVGSDILESRYRILKIDRTAEVGELHITEDAVVYTNDEIKKLLSTIESGNIYTGGLTLKCSFWGLLGFIRFTGAYYMLLVTKRSTVAIIGGHYIYQIDNTELVPLTTTSSRKLERNPEEARFVNILGNLDLARSFYFSYSYDITRTLQHNIIREREALGKEALGKSEKFDYNDMFAWNHYLLEPAKECLKNTFDWCMPIVHGYVDQSAISVYGRVIYITIIARRSRYFAGARFLKRGTNDLGYVANDVETEQIVSEMLTTSFHGPGGGGEGLFENPNYTSYVQHRGSIPLFWTQKNDAATPKPPVEMNLVDPFFSAAALHFDDLFYRYGAPVIVLNLVKSRERTPRESILLKEFTQAVNYLNQFLPKPSQIRYIAWDMSRASKSRDQDVIETLETIAENVLSTTGFFHNGSSLQNGVCRTNCIDCLDRTNAAQFVIGKRALGRQLRALGVISESGVEYDTDAVNLFTHMYHDHGDTIAVQYAGSHLVNTMETYRKINQWTSHSRDMVESFKRYYNNSFLDGQRQEAYNLFLGNYIFAQGQPMLWDLSTDYYLHHADPRGRRRRRSYTKWWTPKNLEKREFPPTPPQQRSLDEETEIVRKPYNYFDDYWLEHYRPHALSNFRKLFMYNIKSTLRYIPTKMTQEGKYDLSPFKVRLSHNLEPPSTDATNRHPSNKRSKPVVKIADPPEQHREPAENTAESQLKKISNLQKARSKAMNKPAVALPSSTPGEHEGGRVLSPVKPQFVVGKDLIPIEQRNMKQAVDRSLNPTLSEKETEEYELYMSHPLNLPLVITTETPPNPRIEYVEYVNSTEPEAVANLCAKDEDVALYMEVMDVPENALGVEEMDGMKNRYRAYQHWITTGKLKQQGRGLSLSVGGRG